MQPGPGVEREVRECLVVGERVAGGVRRVVEQQEEAVGAVDLAAAVARRGGRAPGGRARPRPRAARASPRRSTSSVLSTTSVKRRARSVISRTSERIGDCASAGAFGSFT